MKKAFSFAVIFLIIVLIYQFLVILLENSHEVTYKILTSDKEFSIEETYKKAKDEDGYFIKIEIEDKDFVYYLENNYNKRKRIITDVISYEKDDYLCIYPITLKNEDTIEVLCSDGEEIYSYDYVNKKIDISEFLSKLNITKLYQQDTEFFILENQEKFYANNYYNNEYLSVYRYHYITVFNQSDYRTYSFSDKDIYKNNLGIFIGKYFLTPIYKINRDITDYLLVDIKSKIESSINLGNVISDNSYNVGVVDDKLYVFDFDNKHLFEIGLDQSRAIVGSVEKGFKKYVNGEWIETSITDFTQNKIKFNEKVIDVKLQWNYDEIFETKKYFYIREGNKLYKIYKKDLDTRVLILELNKNYSNLQVEDESIYFIHDKYLYRYDQYGVELLVENNEFKYNRTNIYHMYIDPVEE